MSSMHLSQIRKWFLQSPPVEWGISQLRDLAIGALRQGPIPQHIAFVMDGNRRFARSRQIETVEGHNLGFEALAKILEVCYKSGVRAVTIYAFSIENFNRSRHEVDALMALAKLKLTQLAQHGELLQRYGASIRVLGQRELLKPDVLEAIDRAVDLTKDNGDAILNVCFPYTSRDEMTTAVRRVVEDYSAPSRPSTREKPPVFSQSHIAHNIRSRHLSAVSEQIRAGSQSPPVGAGTGSAAAAAASASAAGSSGVSSDVDEDSTNISTSSTLHPSTPPPAVLPRDGSPSAEGDGPATAHGQSYYPDPETIDAVTLNNRMHTAGMPPLDLLVRTSGVERLSDFMLWQVHDGAEVEFLECMWPEFDLWYFLPVLVEWQWRRRKELREGKPTGWLRRQAPPAVKVQ